MTKRRGKPSRRAAEPEGPAAAEDADLAPPLAGDEPEDADLLAEDEEIEDPGASPAIARPKVEGPHRAGYVAIVGRPNVGKSTLLNKLVGQKIAATTHKPQTTRKNLLGIVDLDGAQVLLLDTPGYHRAKGPLNRMMVEQAKDAIADADVVVWMIEPSATGLVTPGNEAIRERLLAANKPVVVAINKIDRLKSKGELLPTLEGYSKAIDARAFVPLSALYQDGLDRLLEEIVKLLPEGPKFYEDDRITDQSERAIAAELIREKVMLETQDELPYAAMVTIESFEDQRPKIVRIQATVHVERDGQKKIVIGKGGERIKAIGTRARKDLEYFLDAKVFLELFVRVTPGWTERPALIHELLEVGGEGE